MALLETARLTKDFGGVTAVDEVDFTLPAEQLCSVIGPNGAGKTTFFNLLTGVLPPSGGQITYRVDGEPVDITHKAPHETAQLGLHRSYQITNIFPTSSVLENVRIAVQAHHGNDGWRFWRNVRTFEPHYEEAYEVLERVDLYDQAERAAATLSHGEKRQLEVGIALAGDPDLLLLDEPTSGVSSEDVSRVVDLLEDVSADHTILLIEHNMDVVMDISDRVIVLHGGSMIADGTPGEVQDSDAVQRAYLGEEDDATQEVAS